MHSVLLITSIAVCFCNDGVLGIVHWDRQDVRVLQGDDLMLTCTATDMGYLDVVRISRKDASGSELTLADNQNIKPPVSGSTRLKVHYTFHHNGSATSVLQYTGVRGEDAGIIRCYRLGNESRSESLNLTVLVPVESVRFSTMSMDGIEKTAEEEKHEIIFVEGVSLGLACTAKVNGSLDSPAVTVSIDTEDVSHLFVPSDQSRIIRSNEGPIYFFSEKKLRYDIRKPDPEWNDAELMCRARQTGFPDVTAKVTLRVQYQPFIVCLRADQYAKVGDSVTLTCQVSSNPDSTIVWTRNSGERLTEDSNTLFTENVIKPSARQVSLNLLALNDSHFSTYTITARNDHGQDEYNITLHQLTPSGVREDALGGNKGNRQNKQKDAKYFIAQSEAIQNQDSGRSQGSTLSSIAIWIISFACFLSSP